MGPSTSWKSFFVSTPSQLTPSDGDKLVNVNYTRPHKTDPLHYRSIKGVKWSPSWWRCEIGDCELTDDEKSPASSGERHVDLVTVGDEAQVLTTPAVCGVGLYLVAGQGAHCAHDYVVPLPACNRDTSCKGLH